MGKFGCLMMFYTIIVIDTLVLPGCIAIDTLLPPGCVAKDIPLPGSIAIDTLNLVLLWLYSNKHSSAPKLYCNA